MDNTSVRPADDIEQVVEAYGNTLFRVAMGIVGNSADAEDAVQETFIKYLDQKNVFDDSEHKISCGSAKAATIYQILPGVHS